MPLPPLRDRGLDNAVLHLLAMAKSGVSKLRIEDFTSSVRGLRCWPT